MILLLMALVSAPTETTRRFALVVGANDGGKDRPTLRYANSDARAVLDVLSELGGVDPKDAVLLTDATDARLRAALIDMKQRLTQAAQRRELILYYSGHSDEDGLLLQNARVAYQELRTTLAALPTDVRVAIFDSCASGALLRSKGGQKRQAFLLDASATPKGHAFITSSSADEAAQESDRIGGSFFTHFFVSGLRGAADVSGDKRVTLNEAYQFAFQETLLRTERTQGGPQHASYDIQLQGSGDLVFTDVRSTRAGLVLAEGVWGRLFVRDQQGRLVVELSKVQGTRIELGLASGAYRITNEGSHAVTVATVTLVDGRRATVDDEAFLPVEREPTAQRGRATPLITVRALVASIVAGAATNAGDERTRTYGAVNLLHGRVAELRGVGLALGVNDISESAYGASIAFLGNAAGEHAGLQLAWGGNWTRTQMSGVQAALAFNGGRGYSRGLQLAGVANYAEALSGMQIGLVNIGGAVSGMQLGLINVASELQGFQLGLINVAQETSGAQLGLASYSGNVPLRLQLYWSEVNTMNAAVRYGSKVLYGIFFAGIQPFYGEVRGSYGLGLGVHGELNRFNIDFDTSAHQLLRGAFPFARPSFIMQARLTIGVSVFERLMPFVGATANLGLWAGPSAGGSAFDNLSLFRTPDKLDASGNVRGWFGMVLGLQF